MKWDFWRAAWVRGIPRLRKFWEGQVGFLALAGFALMAVWRWLVVPAYRVLSAYANWDFLSGKMPELRAMLGEFDILAALAGVAGSNLTIGALFAVGCGFLFLAGRKLEGVEAQLAEELVGEPDATDQAPSPTRYHASDYGISRDDPLVVGRAAGLLASQIAGWADDWDSRHAVEAGIMDPFTALAREGGLGSVEMDIDFQSRFGSKLGLLSQYVPMIFANLGQGMTPDKARRIAAELRSVSFGWY